MESKFCTNCQTHQAVEGGKYLFIGKIKRWKCKHCLIKSEDICAIRTANKADDVPVKTRIGEEI